MFSYIKRLIIVHFPLFHLTISIIIISGYLHLLTSWLCVIFLNVFYGKYFNFVFVSTALQQINYDNELSILFIWNRFLCCAAYTNKRIIK